jgi:WD40 repeat protein
LGELIFSFLSHKDLINIMDKWFKLKNVQTKNDTFKKNACTLNWQHFYHCLEYKILGAKILKPFFPLKITSIFEPLEKIKLHNQLLLTLSPSMDGLTYVTGSRNKLATLWRLTDLKELMVFHGHRAEICVAKISPKGRFLLTGSFDFSVKLFNTSTGKELKTFKDHAFAIDDAGFSLNEDFFLTAGSGDNNLFTYDTKTLGKKGQMKIHSNTLLAQILTIGEEHFILTVINSSPQHIHLYGFETLALFQQFSFPFGPIKTLLPYPGGFMTDKDEFYSCSFQGMKTEKLPLTKKKDSCVIQ